MWTVGFHVQSIRKLVGSVALTPLWRCLSTPPMTATYMSEDNDAKGKYVRCSLRRLFHVTVPFRRLTGWRGKGRGQQEEEEGTSVAANAAVDAPFHSIPSSF